jgi:L-threonylcarbamoyladenylate synthase
MGWGLLRAMTRPLPVYLQAKNRPQFNPLISHFADADNALAAGRKTDIASLLASHFWPGPLTLILERHKDSPISLLASAGSDSVAVRVPDHEIARWLIALTGCPIVAPSANPSGRISPSNAAHVEEGLGSACDMILDGGPCRSGLESTVIDSRNNRAILLRPGPITAEQIKEQTGLILATPENKGGDGCPPCLPRSVSQPLRPIGKGATKRHHQTAR